MEKKSLSIIIPCFNEEHRLPQKFDIAIAYFKDLFKNFEIILVNDGSADKTLNILQGFEDKYKEIRVISYPKNKGKGYAIKQGVERANGEVVGFMDADFSISIKETEAFINEVKKGADLVIGDRRPESSKQKNLTFPRKLAGNLLARVNNFFLQTGGIIDTQCGFKFFKGPVAKRLFSNLKTQRWLWDLEIILKAKKNHFKIIQKDVAWQQIPGSKVSVFKDLPQVLWDLFKIYVEFMSVKTLTIFISITAVILMAPFLINGSSLTHRNGDYSDLVWPDYYFVKQTIIQDHQLPLWNPYIFSGIPEIANPQSPMIYPPNVLVLFLPIDQAIVILIAAHLILGGLFAFLTCRKLLKWSTQASLVTSWGIALSPFFWSKAAIGHVSMLFAMCLFAPAVYFSVKFFERGKLADLFFAGLTMSLIYLNYPTIYFYSVSSIFFVAFFWTLTKKEMKKFLLFLLAPVVSILLILPLFLVQLGAATQITRSGLTLSDLAIPVWSIKRFIGSIFIPSNFISDPETEVWLYPGIMLIVVSLLGFIRLPKVWKAILGGLTLIVLIVTLGSRTPVFEFLVKFVPFFSYFRVVTRDWLIFVVVVSLLAGWGIQKIERFKYPLIFLILVDLTVFSAIRVWFVPKVNQPFSNADLSKLLTVDHQYRYYCTRRCLSAEETIPKNILSADGYHLVILKEYQDVVSRAGGFSPQPYNGNIPDYQVADAQPVAKYLGEMAVKWVISDHYLSDSAFLRVGSQKGYYLYENLDAYPRVRFEDPLDQTVEVLKDTPDVITIETQGQGGKLILADSYYPGWEASINGQVAQIELYNGWARAVEVPPGRVLVEFSFKPFNHLFNL